MPVARVSAHSGARNPVRTAARTRAMLPEEKSERRAAILRAASVLLEHAPQGAFSVDALARSAGVAKGTVYLYFATREEVLLAVHAARQQKLFDALDKALSARRTDIRLITRTVTRFVCAHPEFLPLAANCRGMLETNISADAALAYRRAISERLVELGSRFEALFPALGKGQGVSLLMASYALMLGLWQISGTPECMVEAMQGPELRIFRFDFEKQLGAALVNLWEGATLRRHGSRK